MNQGLDLIEVKDDGSGIPVEDVPYICQAATTSKITDISDLDSLSSYGFRGEALNALCQVGEVSVTTKTVNDNVATVYKFNHKGDVLSSQPSHFPKGTTVSVKNLFLNLPVRKQYLSSKNRMSEELKKVERVVKCLSLIHCKLRVTLTHNKCVIWQKTQVWNIRLSLSQVVPLNIVSNLQDLEYVSPVLGAKVYLLLPKKSASELSTLCMSNIQHAFFIYVNKRPVRVGKIEKMLSKEFSDCFRSLIPSNKYPVCLVSIEVPSDAVDVNLEPNKTKVLLREVDELVACIKAKICDYYYDPEDIKPDLRPAVKRKQPDHPSEDPVVRKACKTIDSNVTVGDINQHSGGFMNATETTSQHSGGFMNVTETTLQHSGGFMNATETTSQHSGVLMNVTETTLSQLPSLLESKENSYHPNLSLGNVTAGVTEDTSDGSIGNSGLLNRNSTDKISELDDTHLPNLDQNSLNDIVPYDSYTSELPLPDSAYQSEGNGLDSSLSLDIHSDDVSNGISRTQWSKGNVVINGKLLGEPTHVSVDTEPLYKSPGMKSETEWSEYDEFLEVNENTLYFQSANEDPSLNQTEDTSFVPGTPPPESKQMENFSTFAKEIRQDMLENNAEMTFGKVASQMVTKWNSLHDSGGKKKVTKPLVKVNETLGCVNKSMLEFVSKKVVRSYHREENISFDINEVKLKLLEKSHQKQRTACELSSEESDVEEELNVNPLIVNSHDMNVDEVWNHLIETIRNNTNVSETVTLSESTDSKYIHGMLLKKYKFRLIGSHDEHWYYMSGKSLGVLNVEHLYRIVTFHKHLRTYQVPCIDLDDCTMFDQHFLHTVLGMDLRVVRVDTRDQNVIILKPCNEIFTLNGVGLLIRKNLIRNDYSILISQKPKDIPAFSSKDTAELLNLASTHKLMEACRPEKVQKLIQTFTEEYCATHPVTRNEEVITELMAYWFEHVRGGKYRFLYDRQVMHELYLFPQTL